MRTTDGELYREYEDMPGSRWVRVNEDGDPIDEDCNEVDDIDDAEQYRNSEIIDMLDVLPATNYFDSPNEVLAEGLIEFRASEERRQDLMRTNPELYEIIKRIDQDEMDTIYPPIDGESQYIRLPNGHQVRNTPENQEIVRDFEEQSKRLSPLRPKHSLRSEFHCNCENH